jgi:type IV pilus assembly protein PilY1
MQDRFMAEIDRCRSELIQSKITGKAMSNNYSKLAPLLAGLLLTCAANAATTYKENFSSTTTNNQWLALNDACLTASSAAAGSGVIPGCTVTLQNGSTTNYVIGAADADKSGALRLTPGTNSQTGAILSNFTFPMSQGLQVTFTTYTYGGDKGGTAKNGADGITFMLTDGTVTSPTTTGGEGGSMGYSCSNGNAKYEGMANAYLGLGIDEFGNYLNPGDNTSSGIYNTNSTNYKDGTSYGANTFQNGDSGKQAGAGWYYQPERIGLRGAGNTTWAWLSSMNSTYYSGSVDSTKTKAACSSGTYVSATKSNGSPKSYATIAQNYNAIAGGYRVLPDSTPIANENTATRVNADTTKNAWPITYKLKLSSKGLLNFSYSYNNGAFQPVLANHDVTTDSGTPPTALRFGFSAGTGGSNNVHEITCFQASPLQSNSSASANTVQSGQVKIGSQIYLASYSSDNWWGSLVSDSLVTTGGVLSVSTTANWDAKCVLTGEACDSMGTDTSGTPLHTIAAQTPDSRELFTWDSVGGAAEALTATGITATQLKALNSGTDTLGSQRLDWLRGGRTNEQLQSPPGTLRARDQVLGDIINSSPTWVGAPTAKVYPDAFADALLGSSASLPENATGAQAYSTFVTNNATRTNVVYVGSNDGFLHGFRAGSYDASGVYTQTNASGPNKDTYIGTDNDGKELLGYMPSAVLARVAASSTGLTSPTYAHDYFVDATPTAADLFYGSKWHTWLVGGVGTGGKEVYALDITDPTQFLQSQPAKVVMGDWTSATLSNLGHTVGASIITRLHNGQWAIIFGNGLGSGTSAGVYIGLVDSTSGAITFTFYDTTVGDATAANANGIAYVTSADLDGDHIADYLYAGDLQGNVWRVDLTDKSAAKWAISKFGNTKAAPLFVAKDASTPTPILQPITTAVTVASVKTGSVNRVMVLFGTGQKTPTTTTSGDTYATGQQTFYGVWDWDMGAWNKAAGSTAQYASLTGTQAIARSKLLSQSVVDTSTGTSGSQVLGYRTLSTSKVVCWQGSTTCASGNTQYGWFLDLPTAKEQIIYNPTIIGGAVVVSTAIPPVISALQCNPGQQSGWTMAFDPASGGGLTQGFFPDASGGYGPQTDGSTISGIQLNAVGTPTTVTYNGQSYLVTQTVTGSAALSPVNPPSKDAPSRISWREIRY